MRTFFLGAFLLTCGSAMATERLFDFSDVPADRTPPGFRSTLSGLGKAGEWKIVWDDVPPALAPLSSKATSVSRRPVLAQVARDSSNFHFPVLVFEGETFSDFTFATHFKTMTGDVEKLAGIVFRFQDEKNYYALYASSRENRFRFFRVVNGTIGTQMGPQVSVTGGEWHEMAVRCEGSHIHCLLDGKEVIPMITDSTFAGGKVGFWTKSDAVSYFVDAKVTFTPREILAQALVRDALKAYPRLLGLKVFAVRPGGSGPVIVASDNEKEIGQAGEATEREVIDQGKYSMSRDKGSMTVTLPLRDRNGDPMAAVRVQLKSFPGETEDTAVARAMPVVRQMQPRAQSLDDLLQ